MVIEIDPKNVDAYLGLADAYVALGKYEKAIEVLENALSELHENSADVVRGKLDEIKVAYQEFSKPSLEKNVDATEIFK